MKTVVTSDLTVRQFTWDILDANTFVIEAGDSVLIVDPVDSTEFYEYIESKHEAIVLLTHAHYDHICGLNRLREIIPRTTVYASKTCSDNIRDHRKNLSNIANVLMAFHEHRERPSMETDPFTCAPADITYEGSIHLEWNGLDIEMSEFYGHSKDSSCILINGKYLFSGDTILPIPTVTRLPGGSTKRFRTEDIPRLEALKERVELVFPGHKDPGKLGDMIAVNKL